MQLSYELLERAAYAVGVGVLIGLERSVKLDPETPTSPGPPPATPEPVRNLDAALGVRTFGVLSLVGFAAALANDRVPYVAPVALAAVALLVLALYRQTARRDPGITTEAAAIGTAVLGALCASQPRVAGVIALLVTILLSAKRVAASAIGSMRRVELTATLQFLVVILIVLPLLPDRPLDPLGVVNPYKVGFLVVLISAIGFVGYFLTRVLGAQRGLGLTGLLGGLTSSTAVTAAMAGESKENPHLRAICAFSTVVANATSFCRVLVMTAILDAALARRLAWSIGAMAVVAAGGATALWISASRRDATSVTPNEERVKLKNPFALAPALKFGAFFVAILVLAKVARGQLGDKGLYVAAAASGLADVDAITMSVAEQTRDGSLSHAPGAIAITIAVVSNAVVKSALSVSTGERGFGRLVAGTLGAATVAGLVVAAIAPGG